MAPPLHQKKLIPSSSRRATTTTTTAPAAGRVAGRRTSRVATVARPRASASSADLGRGDRDLGKSRLRQYLRTYCTSRFGGGEGSGSERVVEGTANNAAAAASPDSPASSMPTTEALVEAYMSVVECDEIIADLSSTSSYDEREPRADGGF